MKNTIIILLFAGCLLSASARQNEGFPVVGAPDTISLGYGIGVDRDRSAWTQAGVGREVLDNAPQIDAAKALYGRIAGLNVYQGVGTTDRLRWYLSMVSRGILRILRYRRSNRSSC